MSDFTPQNGEPRRYKLIGCEIFYRELCLCAAQSRNIVDLQFLTQGLHDLRTEKMQERLQHEIDQTPPNHYDAILLGFALCNNGVAGLHHPDIPLVIPRAHDCIALFFGNRERFDAYFSESPGTYYKTAGWIERDSVNLEEGEPDDQSPFGALRTFEDYVEKYGEENARYLMEVMGGLHNYHRMTYIHMADLAPLPYDKETEALAGKSGLEYDRQDGKLDWLRRLVDGPWEENEFLIVPPGHCITPSHDEAVVKAEPKE